MAAAVEPLSAGERGAIVAGCFAWFARDLLAPLVEGVRAGQLEVFGIPGGCIVALPLGVERAALERFGLAGIRARVVEL